MDDLILIVETKEILLEMVRKWKEGMEKKGLRYRVLHSSQWQPRSLKKVCVPMECSCDMFC